MGSGQQSAGLAGLLLSMEEAAGEDGCARSPGGVSNLLGTCTLSVMGDKMMHNVFAFFYVSLNYRLIGVGYTDTCTVTFMCSVTL